MFKIEFEREGDGRWIAEFPRFPEFSPMARPKPKRKRMRSR
jgi:hypothetical protein